MFLKQDGYYVNRHSCFLLRYHLVLVTKYRHPVIRGQLETALGNYTETYFKDRNLTIQAFECMPDHIHMLVEIPPKMSVSSFMGYLKGKSSLMIFERFSNLKYKYGSRHFWCRGFYVDTVGKNKNAIEEYIKNQEREDMITDQISFKEYTDPFKGSK